MKERTTIKPDRSTVRTVIADTTDRTVVEFGTTDAKGRTVGVAVTTYRVAFTYGPIAPYGGHYSQQPGLYQAVCAQATRNGENFGASQPTVMFEFAEDRNAYIGKRVRSAKARALKAAKV